MEVLATWLESVGELVLWLGIIKIGYNWLWRAFNGSGRIF